MAYAYQQFANNFHPPAIFARPPRLPSPNGFYPQFGFTGRSVQMLPMSQHAVYAESPRFPNPDNHHQPFFIAQGIPVLPIPNTFQIHAMPSRPQIRNDFPRHIHAGSARLSTPNNQQATSAGRTRSETSNNHHSPACAINNYSPPSFEGPVNLTTQSSVPFETIFVGPPRLAYPVSNVPEYLLPFILDYLEGKTPFCCPNNPEAALVGEGLPVPIYFVTPSATGTNRLNRENIPDAPEQQQNIQERAEGQDQISSMDLVSQPPPQNANRRMRAYSQPDDACQNGQASESRENSATRPHTASHASTNNGNPVLGVGTQMNSCLGGKNRTSNNDWKLPSTSSAALAVSKCHGLEKERSAHNLLTEIHKRYLWGYGSSSSKGNLSHAEILQQKEKLEKCTKRNEKGSEIKKLERSQNEETGPHTAKGEGEQHTAQKVETIDNAAARGFKKRMPGRIFVTTRNMSLNQNMMQPQRANVAFLENGDIIDLSAFFRKRPLNLRGRSGVGSRGSDIGRGQKSRYDQTTGRNVDGFGCPASFSGVVRTRGGTLHIRGLRGAVRTRGGTLRTRGGTARTRGCTVRTRGPGGATGTRDSGRLNANGTCSRANFLLQGNNSTEDKNQVPDVGNGDNGTNENSSSSGESGHTDSPVEQVFFE